MSSKEFYYFSKYNCFSYLNKLYINKAPITYEHKMTIFNELFLAKKSISKKDLKNFVEANFGTKDVTTSNGKDLEEINCNMSSYVSFKEIYGSEINEHLEEIEKIIKDIVIFEDKSILERRLKTIYNLSNDKIKAIKSMNYSGYSRLSKRFLNGLEIINAETGEHYGKFIDVMEKTNLNLQQILFSEEYRYNDIINEYNESLVSKEETNTVDSFIEDNIYVSPIMKRSLIQSCRLIDELQDKILKKKIDKYFIECTRTNKEKKQRTKSRYENIKKLLETSEKIVKDFNINFKDLKSKLESNKDSLQSDKVYLYFTQLGKCMYTLNNIDFDSLLDNNKYDIDHIYPQAILKDDSFSNRVLVEKGKNNAKSDKFIFDIPGFLPKDATKFYDMLLDNKLITKEKYRRLTKKQLSSEELNGFVNRQIVATNQATKGLIETLKLYYKVDSKNIIYSKAENISDFRHKYDLVKSRLANNFHHAHDAYLNVVVGKALNTYFTINNFVGAKDFARLQNESRTINPLVVLEKDRKINDTTYWNKNEMLAKINKNLYERYDVLETTRAYESHIMFSKTSFASKGNGVLPIKTLDPRNDMSKYGGIKAPAYSKYVIVKNINKKGKEEYILEPIPTIAKGNIKQYLEDKGYLNFEIVVDKVLTNTKVKHDDRMFIITGVTNSQFLLKNAYDRFYNKRAMKIIKLVEKYNENVKNKRNMIIQEDKIIISVAKNDDCMEQVLYKKDLEYIFEEIKKKMSCKKYSYSVIVELLNSLNKGISNYEIDVIAKIINELLNLLKTNERKSANLLELGLSSNSGILLMSKVLKPGMQLISLSTTGFFEKVIFEVPKDAI